MCAQQVLLSIAGHDPSSGAGVSADMGAANALGVSCCSVITALTVQTSQGVQQVQPVSPLFVEAQLDALWSDMPIGVIKIGMLASRAMVFRLVHWLADMTVPIILDTVFKASIGEDLLEIGARQLFTTRLLPMATLITPNILEAEQLTGMRIRSRAEQLAAAQALLSMGAQAVLLKGGHFNDALAADVLLQRDKAPVWFVAPTIKSCHSHGSGCVLASSIAAGLLQGLSLASAVVQAKALVHGGIVHSQPLGKGVGAVATFGWQPSSVHFPWGVFGVIPTVLPDAFPSMQREIGIYPIVATAHALLPLLQAGYRTLQLRVKSNDICYIRNEIRLAVALCRAYADCQLFINDHWQIAIDEGAFGVHLGQEDWFVLSSDEQSRLRASGLRLGLSSHHLFEMALAHSVRPSYIAIGPVFHTQSKDIAHATIGMTALRHWVSWLTPAYPVVAIGGIELAQVATIRRCGVDGVALISAITQAVQSDQLQQLQDAWMNAV